MLHHAKFHFLWTKQVYRTLELKINLWLGIRALRNHEATKQEIDAWEINSFHYTSLYNKQFSEYYSNALPDFSRFLPGLLRIRDL